MYVSFATASVSLCVVSCGRRLCNDALVLASPPSPHLNSERTFVERERGRTAAPPSDTKRWHCLLMCATMALAESTEEFRSTLTEVNVGH